MEKFYEIDKNPYMLFMDFKETFGKYKQGITLDDI